MVVQKDFWCEVSARTFTLVTGKFRWSSIVTHSVVPQKVFVNCPAPRSGLERPKSQRATCPVASSKMFSGFKSLGSIERSVD
jgi:hypothetical protein